MDTNFFFPRKVSSMLMECILPKVLFGHLRNLTLKAIKNLTNICTY